MANLQCTVWILFCGFFGASVQAGVSITGCNGVKGETRYADVNLQHADHSLTCVNIPAQSTVLWKLNDYDAGTCPPVNSSRQDSCDTKASLVTEALIPRRTSPSESVVTLKLNPYQRVLENAQLQCLEEGPAEGSISSRDTCTVNLIRPAQGTCQAEFMTSSMPWKVRVQCSITSGSSSLGVYKCRLNQITEDQSSKELVGWVDMEQNSLPTGSARCNFEASLDTSMQGPQRYTVQLQPGYQEVDVTFSGSNIIRKPEKPSKVCKPPGLVPEHNNLTCRCSTDNIGQPPGWLRWSRSRGNGDFNAVARGERGTEELEYVTNLSRQDHNITKFRCDAVWAQDIIGPVKVAKVGYPASQVTFSISQAQPVEEGTTVTFSCAATDGRPAPTLTLKKADGKEMASEESSLTHQSEVRCENSGDYTCTAGNGMGRDLMRTTYLNVTCKPRGIQPEAIQPVNYQGEETGFTFELVANPTPSSISFVFLGSQEKNSPSKVKDIAMVGQCRQKAGVIYISSCSVIVNNVTSSAAAGLYQGKIQNQRGSVDFVFEVKVNATMPDTPPEGHTVIVVAAVVGVLVIVIAVIVIAIIIRRRRKGPGLTHESDKSPMYNAVNFNAAENGRERGNRLPASHSTHSPPSAEQPLLSDVDERCPASADLNDQDVYVNVRSADRGIQPAKVSDSAPKGDYAVVQKSRIAESADRMVAGSDSEGPDNVYAVVDKTKKKGQQSPTLSSVPPASDRKVKDSGKSLQGEDIVEGPVYGNMNVQGEAANRQDADSAAPTDADRGREVNQDGLLYVSVDFSDKPAASHPVPPPRDDGVLYSDIDFSRTAPAH